MRRSVIGNLLMMFSVCFSVPAWAMEARCVAEFGGKTTTLMARPVEDPYRFTTDDVLAPFRVSVQFLSMSGKLKTYVYHDAKDRYVLIHAGEYAFNETNCHQNAGGFGLNKIYSAKMEKELFFQCFAVCH